MHPSIRVMPRISESNSRNMIVAMAKYGNHYDDIHRRIETVDEVKNRYAQFGYVFRTVVNRCRDFSQPVPLFENCIGSQWTADGVSVSRHDPSTGQETVVVTDHGTYNDADYWANFEVASEDFKLALESGKHERYLSAVNAGISSIEAFLNHQYLEQMGVYATPSELSTVLENKFSDWPQRFTGQKFDRSGRSWAAFNRLVQLRNENFQHRKTTTSGIHFRDLVAQLNEFKIGICGLLFDLHVHFSCRCPSAIIRGSFFPEIEYVKRPAT